jgi:quercetin dioxygenase-like cupin family protein
MIRVYKLYTDAEGHSRFEIGTITPQQLTQAISLHFKETPPHSAYDWHPAPRTQYVLTLTGTLEFTTSLGEQFTLMPGDVLLAMDTTGRGHKWKMLGDQPWKRAYVVFDQDVEINFTPQEV